MNIFKIFLTIILGSIASFAFPPYGYTALIFISYIGLFKIILYSESPLKSFFYTFLFGLSYYLIGLYWLFSIIKDYDTTYWLFIGAILLGIIIILSLLFGLFGLVSFYLKKYFFKSKFDFLIILSIIATFFEWIREVIFTGFPWFRVSHAIYEIAVFKSYLPFLGEIGVGSIFFILVSLIVYFSEKRDLKSFVSISFYLLLVILISLYLKKNIFTKSFDNYLYIHIIKTDISKEEKGSRNQVYYNVKKYLERVLQEPRPDISIWTESSIPLEYNNIINALQKEFNEVNKNKTEILFGTYISKDQKHFNVIKSSKNFQTIYTKKHLIPFGEYMPNWFKIFKNFLPKVYMSDLNTQKNPPIYKTRGVSIAFSICYEIIFEREIIDSMNKANIIVNASDLGWFDNKIAKDYLLAIAKIRAIESQKPMIYVVNSGNSAFISFKGEVDQYSDYKQVYPRKGTTIFTKYGNKIIFFILFVIFLLILIKNIIIYNRRLGYE